MSSQSPLVCWYREVNCEAVGMSVDLPLKRSRLKTFCKFQLHDSHYTISVIAATNYKKINIFHGRQFCNERAWQPVFCFNYHICSVSAVLRA
jgi:hypothetical protein